MGHYGFSRFDRARNLIGSCDTVTFVALNVSPDHLHVCDDAMIAKHDEEATAGANSS